MAPVKNRFDLVWYWFCIECNARQHQEEDPNHVNQQYCRACGRKMALVGKCPEEWEDAPQSVFRTPTTATPTPQYSTFPHRAADGAVSE